MIARIYYRTIVYTVFALLAFAGNSVLCRLALNGDSGYTLDAISFTIIRLLSGIAALLLLVMFSQNNQSSHLCLDKPKTAADTYWRVYSKHSVSALLLFIYMLGFSIAYIYLDTGVGALILFSSVQITMIICSLLAGKRLHWTEWLGAVCAFFGFVYLIFPSLTEPSLSGFVLMTVAGIAWGLYTLKGQSSNHPLQDTMKNFTATLPLVLLLLLAYIFFSLQLSVYGVMLAVLSGVVASAIGYAIWYSALQGLSSVQAAVVQLLVPVVAAAGGVVWSNEMISLRLLLASVIVLGGLLLVVFGRHYFADS